MKKDEVTAISWGFTFKYSSKAYLNSNSILKMRNCDIEFCLSMLLALRIYTECCSYYSQHCSTKTNVILAKNCKLVIMQRGMN